MRPLPKYFFGPQGLQCIFAIDDNGSPGVGYINKQKGVKTFEVSDGNITRICNLPVTLDSVSNLNVIPLDTCVMLIKTADSVIEHIASIKLHQLVTLEGNDYPWYTGQPYSNVVEVIVPQLEYRLRTISILETFAINGGAVATTISGDGNLIGGYGIGDGYALAAWAYTSDSGMSLLPTLANSNGNTYYDGKLVAVSDDGLTLVGNDPVANRGVTWTNESGLVALNAFPDGLHSTASGCDSSGNIIVGYSDSGITTRAVTWNGSTSPSSLNSLPGGFWPLSSGNQGYFVNRTGSAVITSDSNSGLTYLWTEPTGLNEIGHTVFNFTAITYITYNINVAACCSDDGSVVYGVNDYALSFYRWTAQDGIQLPLVPNNSIVACCSPDGSLVGGRKFNNGYSWYWDASGSEYNLLPLLGVDCLESSITAIANNNDTLCGISMNYSGEITAWHWNISNPGYHTISANNDGYQAFSVNACSDDGSVIVGGAVDGTPRGPDYSMPGTKRPYYWTAGSGLVILSGDVPYSGTSFMTATACSANGSVIAGYYMDSDNNPTAFLWSDGVYTSIGRLQFGTYSSATQVSPDGTHVYVIADNAAGLIVVADYLIGTGYSVIPAGTINETAVACTPDGNSIIGTGYDNYANPVVILWNYGTPNNLGNLIADGYHSLNPVTISRDGSTIVGWAGDYQQAWYWREDTGYEYLGNGPSASNGVATLACSADGSIITGTGTYSSGSANGFVWTAGTGVVFIGLQSYPRCITADGNTIIGSVSGYGGDFYHNVLFAWNSSDGIQPFVWDGTGIYTQYQGAYTVMKPDASLIFFSPTCSNNGGAAMEYSEYDNTLTYRTPLSLSLIPQSQVNGGSRDGNVLVGSCFDNQGISRPVAWAGESMYQFSNLYDDNSNYITYNWAQIQSSSTDGIVMPGWSVYESITAINCLTATVWFFGDPINLGTLYGCINSYMYACSDDGSVIVGGCDPGSNSNGVAIVWTEADGLFSIPDSEIGSVHPITAYSCSADGSVIVGTAILNEAQFAPFMWSAATGTVCLAEPTASSGYIFDNATSCSADGSIIFGSIEIIGTTQPLQQSGATVVPFYWTADTGIVYLTGEDTYSGLGVFYTTTTPQLSNPVGLYSFGVSACSSDGCTLVGSGFPGTTIQLPLIWKK